MKRTLLQVFILIGFFAAPPAHAGASPDDVPEHLRGGYLLLDDYERPVGGWLDWPVIPVRDPDHADLAYGEHHRQRIDLWLPVDRVGPANGETLAPLVVFYHFGGFGYGSKAMVPGYAIERFNAMGIAMASAGYRYLRDAPMPGPLLDGARALQFLRHHADRFGLDRERVAAFGISAGAIISMYMGYHEDLADPRSPDPVARESTRVMAVVSIEGQPTFHPDVFSRLNGGPIVEDLDRFTAELGLPGARYRSAPVQRRLREISPITHVTPDDPPTLLYYIAAALPGSEQRNKFFHVIHHPVLGDMLVEELEDAGVPWLLQVGGQPRRSSGLDDRGEVFEILGRMLVER